MAPFTKTGVPEVPEYQKRARMEILDFDFMRSLDFMSKRQYGNGGAHMSGAQR